MKKIEKDRKRLKNIEKDCSLYIAYLVLLQCVSRDPEVEDILRIAEKKQKRSRKEAEKKQKIEKIDIAK